MTYIYLSAAIIAEVIATAALNSSAEFTRLYPSLVVLLGYSISFYFMSLTLKTLPLGMTYAIWSGLGLVLITALGAWKFQEIPNMATVLGMLFIIAGVVVIHLSSTAEA